MIVNLADLRVRLVKLRHAGIVEERVEVAAVSDEHPLISLLPAEASALAWMLRQRSRDATS